jgi:hypothetical protein
MPWLTGAPSGMRLLSATPSLERLLRTTMSSGHGLTYRRTRSSEFWKPPPQKTTVRAEAREREPARVHVTAQPSASGSTASTRASRSTSAPWRRVASRSACAQGSRAPGPPTAMSCPRPIRSLRQATGGSSGRPCASNQDHASASSSTRIRCSSGSPRGIQRRASSNVAGAQIRPPLSAIEPPTEGSLSRTRTSPPASAAESAAVSPAMPPPITITSLRSFMN